MNLAGFSVVMRLTDCRHLDLVNSLESALPRCYLSYKQIAPLSPYFAALTSTPQHSHSTLLQSLSFHIVARPSPTSPLESALTKTLGGGGLLRRLSLDPALHMRLQHAQGHRALLQDGIMKCAHIEPGTKPPFRFRAQLANLELPQLVRQRLPRPNDVAIHLDGNVLIGFARVV